MHTADSAPASRPVIITVAPVDYTDLRTFPSAAALADDIVASHAAGAAVVHFHVTDAQGTATSQTAFFDDVVRRVRQNCDIIIQASTGGVGVPWEVRTASLRAAHIEMASLNMGTCNLFGRAYVNTPDDIGTLAAGMHDAGVVPDMCFFEPGFFTSLAEVEPRLPPARRKVFSLCLGFPGTLPATVENLVFMVSKVPVGAEWTLVHHGAPDFALLSAAIAAGGNIRVGFEDSAQLGGGARARRNAELVAQVRSIARLLGRSAASAVQTRVRYGIEPHHGRPAPASGRQPALTRT